MNGTELINDVAGRADVTKGTAGKCIDAVFEAIGAALARGEEVRVAGFGAFTVKTREAREGRNPRTGEKIQLAAGRSANFKPLKGLRDQLAS